MDKTYTLILVTWNLQVRQHLHSQNVVHLEIDIQLQHLYYTENLN